MFRPAVGNQTTYMKKIYLATLLGAVVMSFAWKNYTSQVRVVVPSAGKDIPITMCSGSFFLSDTSLAAPRIMAGLGTLHHKVTTTSPLAQEFFDQGLRLYYGYNQWEALRSFGEAARLDPGCGMAYWGMALALGPYINDPNPKDRERLAFETIQKAKARSTNLPLVEKDFIDALASRFDGKAYDDRSALNQSYYKAMALLAKKYPDDPEAQTLLADALMSTVPWQWWDLKGNPKPQTLEARPVLENILKKLPNHPGANHLYIHLMEESPMPELANASARFLETALPGAGHLVHMPGHIYQRTGDYNRSIETNKRAVAADEAYLAESVTEDYGFYRAAYHPHNIDFICYSSYMSGQNDLASRAAAKLVYRAGPLENMMPALYDYILAEPMTANIRFGKWNDILAQSLPDPKRQVAMVMWRYARGLAYLRKGFISDARTELRLLDSLNRLEVIKSLVIAYNSAGHLANIATHTLKGELLLTENKFDQGIQELKSAAESEDTLQYNEPPDWRIPVRHNLGAALLAKGRYAEAEQVYLEDLKRNRENGWALQGLFQSQLKLGKTREAGATRVRFEKAWKNADVKIATSVF